MKRINLGILIVTFICSFITIMGELDRGIVIVLKDSSIVLTATVPYILNKFFNTKINDGVIFVWLIFIFLAHYMGVTAAFYNKWEGFDKVVHAFSGVLTACISLFFVPKKTGLGFKILFAIAFSWMCAGLWETFEFVCNIFVGGDAQKVATTGVTDTMMDMIVAFGGACLFCLYYFVKEKVKN